MKQLIQEVTFTKYAKVEVRVVDRVGGKSFYDMTVTASKQEMALRKGEWVQGTFVTTFDTLTPSEVYYHINRLFAYSEYIATGLLKRIDLVGLNEAWLKMERRMDYLHQEANEMNAAYDMENADQLYIVDLDNPEGDVYKTDLEDAKSFLCNIWQDNEEDEVLEEVHDCTTIDELNEFMRGCDYEVMTEAEHLKYIKEFNCKGYDETCTCITCQDRRELVEQRYEGLGYGSRSTSHESLVSQPRAYEMVKELKQSGFQEENYEGTFRGLESVDLIDRANGIRYEFNRNQSAAAPGKAYTVKVFSKS
jgi:hypothetical protein